MGWKWVDGGVEARVNLARLGWYCCVKSITSVM